MHEKRLPISFRFLPQARKQTPQIQRISSPSFLLSFSRSLTFVLISLLRALIAMASFSSFFLLFLFAPCFPFFFFLSSLSLPFLLLSASLSLLALCSHIFS